MFTTKQILLTVNNTVTFLILQQFLRSRASLEIGLECFIFWFSNNLDLTRFNKASRFPFRFVTTRKYDLKKKNSFISYKDFPSKSCILAVKRKFSLEIKKGKFKVILFWKRHIIKWLCFWFWWEAKSFEKNVIFMFVLLK